MGTTKEGVIPTNSGWVRSSYPMAGGIASPELSDYGGQGRRQIKLLDCPSRLRKRLVFENRLYTMRSQWTESACIYSVCILSASAHYIYAQHGI